MQRACIDSKGKEDTLVLSTICLPPTGAGEGVCWPWEAVPLAGCSGQQASRPHTPTAHKSHARRRTGIAGGPRASLPPLRSGPAPHPYRAQLPTLRCWPRRVCRARARSLSLSPSCTRESCACPIVLLTCHAPAGCCAVLRRGGGESG